MSPSVPAELTGLWRRELITAPGLRDDATRVFWLQTRSWYVDIRVPADRPAAGGRSSLAAFSAAELLQLARVEGFAGQLSVANGACAWRRDLDHQPPAPTPDEGRYTLDGDVMIEDGVHLDYRETWRRQPASAEPLLAFRLEEQDDPRGGHGLMVVGGRHLLEFVSRPGPALSAGASLADLVAAELGQGRRPAAEALLSTRIRYATAAGDGRWSVALSSLPWLEGAPMWSAGAARFDSEAGVLEIADGEASARWRLLDASPGADGGCVTGAG
ncbi:hypothetical protein LJR225_001486 [Phenylobacterium sp. LjRoot225]|uniref:hypothetical protein n=1 Tax=Phenylobacterium sp. LjRoot225 TaxID=3342285 RepID=UPI003ECC9955